MNKLTDALERFLVTHPKIAMALVALLSALIEAATHWAQSGVNQIPGA